MENLQTTKQRFGIIGNDTKLNMAIEKAIRVAPTDISVLVAGESGVGKESIPKIIHQLYLVMKKELLQALQQQEKVTLKLLMVVLFF